MRDYLTTHLNMHIVLSVAARIGHAVCQVRHDARGGGPPPEPHRHPGYPRAGPGHAAKPNVRVTEAQRCEAMYAVLPVRIMIVCVGVLECNACFIGAQHHLHRVPSSKHLYSHIFPVALALSHTSSMRPSASTFSRSFASAYVYMHLGGRIQVIGSAGKGTQTLGAEEDGDPLPESDPSGEVWRIGEI